MEHSNASSAVSKQTSTTPNTTHHQNPQIEDATILKTSPKSESKSNRNNSMSPTENENRVQSYYADKDLAWWLQLARDFKSARQLPLPTEEGDDL